MKLTKPQQNAFWKLFQEAARKMCRGGTDEAKTAYRHKIIYQTTGKTSLTQVARCGQYERLMCALAVDAEDYQAAGKWSSCDERRTVYFLKECARQIGEIVNEPKGWDYCRATLTQAGLPPRWEDVPAEGLWSTFMALDTYRRKLLKRRGWCGRKDGQPLSFYAPRIYFISDGSVSFYDPIGKDNLDQE